MKTSKTVQIVTDSNKQLNDFLVSIRKKKSKLLISNTYKMLAKIRAKRNRLQAQANIANSDNFTELSLESFGSDFPEMSIFDSNYAASLYSCYWDNIDQTTKPNLYEMLWNNIEAHENAVFIIRIGFVNFKCFSLVLSLYTTHFLLASQTQIQKQKQTVFPKQTLRSKITAAAFAKLYNWMLNDEIIITRRDVLQLVSAAEELNIEELKNQCWLVLDNAAAYCEHVAYELYKDAGRMEMAGIQQLMLPRVCRFFLYLVAMDDFLQMDTDEVCQWLSSNSIGVNSEMEVLYAAVLWLNSKWNDRRSKPLRKVMSCVRFGLMPPWFLVTLNAKTKNPDVNRVIKQSKVKRLIADGLSLTTTLLFYSKNSVEFDEFLKRSNLKVPMQRKWIIDNACPYHYCEGSQILRHIDYDAFIDYLHSLRSFDKCYWRSLEVASQSHWSYVCSVRPDVL